MRFLFCVALALSLLCTRVVLAEQPVVIPMLPGANLPVPESPERAAPAHEDSFDEGKLELLGCILEPSTKVEVSSPVAGVLSRVPVNRGDRVSKGQVLFELGAGVEAAAVNLARAKSDFAERKKDRNLDLFEDGLLSPHERDEIETEMQIAQMELRLKQQELALRTVYSPVSGVITETHYSTGEYVTLDPIISMATLDPLHVDLLLPARYFGRVTKGDPLNVLPEQPVGGSYPARVSIVDPLVDPASGTFRVRLVLPNPGHVLPAGIRCSVTTDGNDNNA